MNLFLWTVFLPEGYENGIIQRFLTGDYMAWGSISLFAGFLENENSLETLIVIFEKFHKRVFSDWIWIISKFPFWRRILDIYGQQLLRSGTPIPPCAGDRLTSSLSSSGRDSARPNDEGRKEVWITSSMGSTYSSKDSMVPVRKLLMSCVAWCYWVSPFKACGDQLPIIIFGVWDVTVFVCHDKYTSFCFIHRVNL